ncbi:MAG TPA: SusC/RagA family TonB-linked outer membrane protein [Paludibacter sp.]|nr:SusC/RagA family TonB-linked outer membrane protein [Paludibacter sp.]
MKQIKYLISVIALIVGFNLGVNAQKGIIETEIKGTVYESATGKPLAGAQVTIPGVASVITAENGSYVLKKSFSGAYLNVHAPGFAPKRVPVVGKSTVDVWLLDETFKGKYEEVATLFDMSNAAKVTTATSTHENRTDYLMGSTSIENILQGHINGINTVSRSGMPGAGANLFLNGLNSLNANSQPLIIVDGVIFDNQSIYSLIGGNNVSALSDIDVKDIDNITVLKDGASVYGSKAANGVIIINTLRAKDAATRINFHASMGVNFEPTTKYPMMNAWNYKNYLTDMMTSYGMTESQVQAYPFINSEKPVIESWGVSGNADYYRYNQSTDWQDQVFKTSFNKNYHVNITGGNDATLYAISVGYLGNAGLVENTSYSRYTTRVNAQIKMTDWFKLNANVNFVYTDRGLTFEGLNKNFNPVYAGLVKAPFTAPYVYNVEGVQTPNLEDADVFGVSNPRAIIENSNSFNNRFRFFSSMNGVITFSKYLNADVIFGLTTDKVTKESVFMPNAGINHTALASGLITNETQQLRNHLFQINTDFRLTYKRTYDLIHDVTTRVGVRYQSGDAELDWGKAYNTSSDEMKMLSDGKNTLAEVGGSLGNWKSISNYLNIEYGYANRYYLSLNAALDGSSRFGSNAVGLKIGKNVFGLFPSLTGAWLLTSEDFMRDQTIFDVLKIRAGYSVTGNDDIGNYSSRHYYVSQGLLGAYGLLRGNIPNTSLKWETNKKAVFGIDGSLLKERLNFSIDVYNSRTEDLISVKDLSTISGFGFAIMNDGSLQNNGIDVNINGRIIDNKDFKWDAALNVSTYKNKLMSLSTDEKITTVAGGLIRTKVGSPLAQFYGYQTEGILNSTEAATAANLKIKNPYGVIVPFTAGDVQFADNVKDGFIDEKDMTVIGDPNPDFFGSFVNNLQYKRFSFNAIFTYMVGNDIYNALRANLESMSSVDNQTDAIITRWKYNDQVTNVPKATWGDPMQNARFSDRWIEDGSYLRLKSLTLGYELPLKVGFITSAQVYVTGSNLLTFTNYLGYDPEFSTGQSPIYAGIDTGVTPQPRTILFGIKVGL